MKDKSDAVRRARRDALIASQLHLVAPIARALRAKLPSSFQLEDLIATGNLALVQAAENYKPAQHGGAPFSAYARLVVRGAILDSVSGKNYDAAKPERNQEIVEQNEPAIRASLEETIDQTRRAAKVRKVVEMLPNQHRAVVETYFGPEEPAFERVAQTLGIHKKRVRKLCTESIDQMRVALKEAA